MRSLRLQRPKPKKGQQLLWVDCLSPKARGRVVTVTKVGRKYAHLDNGERVTLDTWIGTHPDWGQTGRCFASEAEYRRFLRWECARAAFHRALVYLVLPENVTIKDLEQISDKLGIRKQFELHLEGLNKSKE